MRLPTQAFFSRAQPQTEVESLWAEGPGSPSRVVTGVAIAFASAGREDQAGALVAARATSCEN